MKTLHKEQPKRLKRVTADCMQIFFEMNVSKKRIIELIHDKDFECFRGEKCFVSPVTIETNSVWYDKEGNCCITKE